MDNQTRARMIDEHQRAIRELIDAPVKESDHPSRTWPPDGYYLLWHVLIGMILGGVGASVSLLFNVIGAPLAGRHSLDLIRVYLTFPMGEAALSADSGAVLTVGCILYLVTGGLYGVVFHLLMSTLFLDAPFMTRLVVASAIGLGLWIINFYLILSWLQPLMLGGSWILTELPFWVAALTHLVFAWTMLAGEAWGGFERQKHRDMAAA